MALIGMNFYPKWSLFNSKLHNYNYYSSVNEGQVDIRVDHLTM